MPPIDKPTILTPARLRWYFCEAEAAMGVRSTHGAFVAMAETGPPTGGGSKSNGVEARSVETWHLDAVARERQIYAALQGKPARHVAIVAAAYGPGNWLLALPSPVRVAVAQLFGESTSQAADVSLVQIAPLTPIAQAHAARRREMADSRHATPPPSAPTSPKAPKDRPSERTRKRPTPAAARADLFRHDPALAASPKGAVIDVACSDDKTRRAAIVAEARKMLADAHAALGVAREPRPPAKTRSVHRPAVEPASMPHDGEAFACL